MSNLKRLGRRRFLARAGGSLGALLLSGCDGLSANPGFTKILESAETVSRSVQSALTGRTALAREYTESDLSAEFRANGTTEPTDPDYQKLAQNGLKIGASLWTASFRSLQVSRWPNSTRRSTTPGVAPVCIMDELQFQTADPPRLARQTPDDRDSRGHPGPKGALGHRRAAGGRGADQYFDRINLSVGAPQLQQEFGLTDGELGWLFSGFFWSYALLQIPTGMILDRFGVTSVYRVSAFLWSLASGATAFASGFIGILAVRLVLGVAEGPAFPASAKATGYWFPRAERATATAIFDAASKFANVIGVPLVAMAVVQFGWLWGFIITGLLSFLYFLAFLIVYRDPSRHPRLSPAERDYIRAGGATRDDVTTAIAKTGVVGLLRNGEGPTVMLRADEQ